MPDLPDDLLLSHAHLLARHDEEAGQGRSPGRQHGMPGRFVVFRDRDGRKQAVSRHAVSALSEEEGTTTMLLPGGRVVLLELPIEDVVALLSSP